MAGLNVTSQQRASSVEDVAKDATRRMHGMREGTAPRPGRLDLTALVLESYKMQIVFEFGIVVSFVGS